MKKEYNIYMNFIYIFIQKYFDKLKKKSGFVTFINF